MTHSANATFVKEAGRVEGAFPIDMYVINASYSGTEYLYYVNMNQDVVGYQLNASGEITSATTTYTAIYSERAELDTNIESEISSVTVSIPNVNREIESIIQTRDYLRGCEVHLISSFAKHLPSGTGANYLGEDPDYRACLKEKFYVDSVTSNEEAVSFELKSKFDIKDMVVPARMFSKECQWAILGLYLGTECDVNGSINSASYPTCDGSLNDCRKRGNTKRFGGFASVPRRGFVVL
jgi:lambda family phage minor tail protein L